LHVPHEIGQSAAELDIAHPELTDDVNRQTIVHEYQPEEVGIDDEAENVCK
jgi:hypothetical protein